MGYTIEKKYHLICHVLFALFGFLNTFFLLHFLKRLVPTSMGTWLTLMKGLMRSMGQIWPRVKNPWGKSGHHFLIIVELSNFADMFIINKITSLTTFFKKILIFKKIGIWWGKCGQKSKIR